MYHSFLIYLSADGHLPTSFLDESPQTLFWRADFGKNSYPLPASKPGFSRIPSPGSGVSMGFQWVPSWP